MIDGYPTTALFTLFGAFFVVGVFVISRDIRRAVHSGVAKSAGRWGPASYYSKADDPFRFWAAVANGAFVPAIIFLLPFIYFSLNYWPQILEALGSHGV